uniref:Fructose facilitator n=1 Tax=Zygosaccharomyces kombuchaensis TaxID=166050 RepID=A0A0P0IPX6_9SACH|nr:fructose facilitator [Zygosaccharomyces kombuchaensis]
MVKIDGEADEDWNKISPQKKLGRVCGGKYLKDYEMDESSPAALERPLTKVEGDVPLTYTECIERDGKEWVVLTFAPGDKENPFNWSSKRKWFYTWILNLMCLMIGLGNTVYNSTISHMCAEFNRTVEIGQLGLFVFNQTSGVLPLFLAPFCELAGRQVVYTIGFVGFCLCFIGLALGRNMATILVMRTLQGGLGSIGTILVGGTFDDMFIPDDRAVPMALFSHIAIFGTMAAPIYAGFADQAIGWRWIEGIQGLSNIPLLTVVVLCFKETRGGVFLQNRAKILRKDTGDERWVAQEELEAPGIKEALYNSSVKAIAMLLSEPVVFFFGMWIAFTWFITFLFLSVITITFSDSKHWPEGTAGLPYISLCIGVSLGFILNFLQIRKYNKIRARATGAIIPEHRLYGAMAGGMFLPIGLFIYSFTQYFWLHWIGPNIGLACIALGIFFIFESCYSYTSDCYGPSASSAIAGQSYLRNELGAVAPLFANQMFVNMHCQFAGLLCACVATGLGLLPFILFKFGPIIRAKSKRAIVYEDHMVSGDGSDSSDSSVGNVEKSDRNDGSSLDGDDPSEFSESRPATGGDHENADIVDTQTVAGQATTNSRKSSDHTSA